MTSDFPHQEIRSLLLEYLAHQTDGQFASVVRGVVQLAKSHGLYSGSTSNVRCLGGADYDLGGQDARRVPESIRQLLWQFLVQGLIVFGSDDMNPNWPWYRVTEYGRSVLSQQGARPYDPDGFLKEFATINPNADTVVLDYLEEAIRTFNTGCFKAAAVMLGCASEQLILVLLETFEAAICDPAKKKSFAKSYRWTVSSKFSRLREALEGMIEAKKLPKELCDAVRSDLVSGFELIRRFRNSAGHPELPSEMRRETVYLNLTVFPEYARQVLLLVEYFRTNPAEI